MLWGESKQKAKVNMDELTKELKVTRAQFAVFKESVMQKMKEVMAELGIVCDEVDTDTKKRNCLEALREICEGKYQKLLEWFSDRKDSNS